MNTVQKRVFRPMTDNDLEKYIGSNKIVKYSDLDDYYNSIYDLLPLKIDFRIILFETTRNSGHWVLIVRKNNVFIYFDSYGDNLGSLYSNNSINTNLNLGNEPNTMKKLLKTIKSDSKLIINTYSFQSKSLESESCGRWDILFLKLFLDYNYNLSEFYKFVKQKQKQMNYKNLDEVAAYYIV